MPQGEFDEIPFQTFDVLVSARSAPHRFFFDDGTHFDELKMYLTPLQRSSFGSEFDEIFFDKLNNRGASRIKTSDNYSLFEHDFVEYDSLASHLGFRGGNDQGNNEEGFFMSDIIGAMDFSLGESHPATVVNVENGEVYIISATEGSYNPCPNCRLDNWLNIFSPFPNSNQGRGLEPMGGIASREQFQGNVSLANYEDNIFGRACWVPPTMIAYSHFSEDGMTAQEARKARLETQAALYVNGYQRDWYGFNKGALIGSFDGVKWFAIGGGRRVIADSNKLFLAINSPFTDLAVSTEIRVSIIAETGDNIASDHDFDPALSSTDARIESAATCRKYHQCENDADCVTQLGWEYMCADVKSMRTNLPAFTNANEESGEDNLKANVGVNSLLMGGLAAGTRKRCVYRGAGAICKKNFLKSNNFYPENEAVPVDVGDDDGFVPPSSRRTKDKLKLITCAPNFHCASISSDVFNNRIVRDANNQSNIFFGQDTDVLGRPLHYQIDEDSSLGVNLEKVKKNLVENFKNYDSITDEEELENDWGICRQEKKFPQMRKPTLRNTNRRIVSQQVTIFHKLRHVTMRNRT